MITKRELSWFRMLFSVRGSGLDNTYPRILTITAFSALVTYLQLHFGWAEYSWTVAPFTLTGFAIGIFLGFRNNSAYERYWEGRKLWGALINASRNFARETCTLLSAHGAPPGELEQYRRSVIQGVIAFSHALRCQLRGHPYREAVAPFLAAEELDSLNGTPNVPQAILRGVSLRLQEAWHRGWLTEFHLPVLEDTLRQITDVQGGCERIKNTPFPFAYTVLMHQIVACYCFFLTFGLVKDVQAFTPLVVMLISHAFLGLDEIGNEIEDPFGTDANDLPLLALCRTIEINLRQQLGDRDLPPPLEPVDGILS